MSISKETKVGVFAGIAITILVLGYNFLKGKDLFTTTNKYFAIYKNIDGLIVSNPVLVNGYRVGQVTDVEMDKNTLLLTVTVRIPEHIKIPVGSQLKITNSDLIGSKAMDIVFSQNSEYAKSGDTLVAIQDPGLAQAISGVLTPLTTRVNSILGGLDTAINQSDITGAIDNASLALHSFKETADKLNVILAGKDVQIKAILDNLQSTSADIKGISPKIDKMVNDLSKTTADLAKVDMAAMLTKINALVAELNTVSHSLNQKEGTLGLLINDKETHIKLNNAIQQFKALMEDIEKYPRRYTGFTERQRKKGDEAKSE